MKCALAAIGFIDGNVGHNKAVIAETVKKCAGKADAVIFGEAFLQGFYGINFFTEHDETVAIACDDAVIREISGIAKRYSVAVSFGFIEKAGDDFFSSQITIDKCGRTIDLYRRVSPGWKEATAGKEYREGKEFRTFDFLGKQIAVALCGDLWYEENVTRLNALKPDIVWWPVYTDYNYAEWNDKAKFEYAEQAGKINAPVFYVNSVCIEKFAEREVAKGGAAVFEKGVIKEELLAGNEGILIVEF